MPDTTNTIQVLNTDNTYQYVGLSKDIPSKLPTTNINSGSIAYCIDTQGLYMFEETNSQWYEI